MKNQIFKYSIFVIFLGLFITSCANRKKETANQEKAKTTTEISHNWTDHDILAFEKNCNGFLIAQAVENPEKYTDCLLKTVIEEYPNPDDAISLNQNELVALFENSNCLDDILLVKIESPWDEEVEKIFLKECLANAKKNYSSEEEAKTYCDCALEEIKKIIPNPQHVIMLTEEELNTILENCK